MIRLLAFLVLFATVADAQSYLQFRRGNTSALPTGQVGEPLFTRDSLDVYMGSDSGNVLVGGRSVVYGKATFAKDAGSTDAYAITLAPAPTKYWNGMRLSFMANTANTGSATLNVNSLGAKTIYKGGLASDTLVTGDIGQYDRVTVLFADSAFFIQYPPRSLTLTSLTVNGSGTFDGTLDVDSVAVAGGVKVNGRATFDGVTRFEGPVSAGDSIFTESNIWVDGNATVGGALNVAGQIVHSSSTYGHIMVPNVPGWVFTGASSSTGYTQALNDSLFVWGQYLPTAVKLGKVALYTGTLTGSSPTRTVSIAVYNSSKALVDSTAATAYVASDVMPANFTRNATIGPGWVFFAVSVYFSTTGTMRFNVAAADVSYATAAILSGQSTTFPIIGTSAQKLTAGTGWPATLSVSRLTASFQIPVMHIWGTDVD